MLIRRGELVAGALCKNTLGTKDQGLVHVTWIEHGPDATRRLINNIQVRYRTTHGVCEWIEGGRDCTMCIVVAPGGCSHG